MGLTSKIFGSSKNKKLDTLTREQKNTLSGYLNAINPTIGTNVNTLQGYAEEGYNPYDAIQGTALVGQMKRDIDENRQAQLNAIKGGPMNRFSMASAKASQDAYDNAQKQQTSLDYQDLMTKANFGQQAYGNQIDAINRLFGQSNAMLGVNAFQNQTQVKKGILDYVNQGAGSITNVANAVTSLGKMPNFGGTSSTSGATAKQ